MSERILAPGMAPTPFTADEIRQGCPDGHWTLRRIEDRRGVRYQRDRYVGGDATHVTLEQHAADAGGTVSGQPRRSRPSSRELQAHASFPADATTVAEEAVELPIGTLACRRYEVVRDGRAMRFWFADAHPGMPVRYEVEDATVTVIGIGDGEELA